MDAIIALAILFGIYFLPAILAEIRGTVNAGGVFVFNLLLGWTLLGWIIALAMAAGGMRRRDLKR